MIILKVKSFEFEADVAKFINVNKIKKEDILSISTMSDTSVRFIVFFYADSAAQEISRGFFGWD
jgi:hypothetical protein